MARKRKEVTFKPEATTAKPSEPKSKVPIGPPQPFSLPPSHLEPFYSTLDPSHVYLTHIDTQDATLKRRVFIVPVLMNIGFAAALLWRSWVALPTYFAIFIAAFGHHSEQRIDISNTSWNDLITVIMSRTFLFLMDYFLAKFILPWPLDFFFGTPSNPIEWRRNVGFQDKEITVRVSRKWDKELQPGWVETEEMVIKQIVMPALGAKLQQKTGYLLMDKYWDLDFAEMIYAHAKVESKKLSLDDFEKAVWIHSPLYGWAYWRVDGQNTDTKQREKISACKDKLTAMGKENLFYKWVELIQYESTQPGGFSPERQEIAMRKAKEMFEKQGVDFEQFWKEVGGTEGLPGMDR